MSGRELMPARVRRLFRLDLGRRRVEEETDAELRFHLEQRVQALIEAGRSPDDARAEALARFGPYAESRAQLLEAARRREETLTMLDRFDGFRQDVAYVARQLRRAPGFTLAVVLTFAFGIGANATMFAVIDQVLLRPPAHVVDPGRMMAVVAGIVGRDFGQNTSNYPVYKAIRDHSQGWAFVAAEAKVDVPLGRGEGARSIGGLLVSANYFSMLGLRPAIGRFFREDEDAEPMGAPVAVLSHGFWQRQFAGSSRAIGSTLLLGDRQFTVIGIAPPRFTGLELAAPDVWIPITSGGALQPMGRTWATNSGGTWLRIFARIRPDVPPERAAADAMRVAREAAPNAFFTGPKWQFRAVPIIAQRATEQGAGGRVMTLLGAMSLVVLLIACANVANLLLARALRRRREIAVRLALGVARGRLLALLLTESVLLALLGGAAALLVAYWGGTAVRRLLLDDLALDAPLVDGRVLAFTAVIALVVGLLTGLMPALQASGPSLASALKEGNREGGQRSRARRVLLVAQAALCFVLLAGAGVFVRSLTRLAAMPLGVDVDRVLIGSMDLQSVGRPQSDVDAIFTRALERVQAIPGVAHAAVAATVPFGWSFGAELAVPGPDSVRHTSSMLNVISPDYFKTLGSRLLIGRDFQASDGAGASRVVIINQMLAANLWGRTSPIGRCIRLGSDTSPCAEVVGVVENVRRQSLFEDSTGFVYLPLGQARQRLSRRQLIVRPAGNSPTRMIEPVRTAMQTAAPQLPYADVHLVADEPIVRQELRPTRLGASMFGVFGLLALALAALGIYAVVSYDVGQRTREMGVRLALGARELDVAGLVMRDGVRVIAFGAAIGIGAVLLGGKFVAPLLYQISPRDPLVIVAVATTLIGVAMTACLIPAWRAMRVDAAVALRSE